MTPTIKLNTLSISNFGPFVGTHTLELPSHGLHMVLGENQDTDESSGAGKSSLVESLAFAFDYSAFAGSDLQSWEWLTKEPMEVGVDFSVNDVDVSLRRGKKPSLKVEGKDIFTSAKTVKEELGRLVGVRPEILKALTYRAQGQPGLFLSMTDSEKKSFLTELLGLQMYETEAERIVKVVTSLEQQELSKKAVAESLSLQVPQQSLPPTEVDTSELAQRASQLSNELLAAELYLSQLKESDTTALEAQRARETEVRSRFEPYIENLNLAVTELRYRPVLGPRKEEPAQPVELPVLKKKLSMLREAISKAKSAHQAKLKQLRQDVQSERNEINRLRSQAQSRQRVATNELERLEVEVSVLEQQVCDRCKREWCDESHKLVLEEKRAAIVACQTALNQARNEMESAEQAEHRMKEAALNLTFEESRDPVLEKLAEGEREFTQKVAETEATYRAECASTNQRFEDSLKVVQSARRQEIAEAERTLSKAEGEYIQAMNVAQEMTVEHVRVRESLGAAKDLLTGLYADRRVVQERIESAQARHREVLAQYSREMDIYTAAARRACEARAEQVAVLTKLDQERDYLGVIRSFLGVIFHESLDRIAYLTSERLSRVPNVQSLTLRFDVERETKTTKNLRQEIKAIVERDGHEIPLKRTSGGQYTAVELAVDLSLADVISERTGVMPGWIILDEAFNGLPIKSKMACLELLKDAAQTRLILVVDHASEITGMFDSNIVIRSRDGRSSFA